MKTPQIDTALESRKSKFVHFRWLLFIWLGAVTFIKASHADLGVGPYVLLGLFAASQAALWLLPPSSYDGMRMLNAIYLMDLNFILAGFWVNHQMQGDLVMMLFLGTFMAALSKNLAQSLSATLVIFAVYFSAKMKSSTGFSFSQPEQLLQLPFLFISSAHSSLLAQEAASDLEARQLLAADKSRLSRQMHSTFSEIAHYCKDMSALVDALPFGALMLDGEGKVRVCNDIAEEVLGCDASALMSNPLESHSRAALLTPYLGKAMHEPLADFMSVELPSDSGGSWSLNLGVYPVREGDENRGLLLVLIPQGLGETITEVLPKPLILPSEAKPILEGTLLSPAYNIPGLTLAELGLNYG